MATVTVVTAERTLEIEATSIVSGDINDDGHLILVRHDDTPIDMGAVSGMKVNPGSGYVKADVFAYVGPSDPGSVPDGSVWYDTASVSGPVASETQQGLVELATVAEAATGTDTQRAVTAAGLKGVADLKQPIDSDLTAFAALAPANNDVVQRKSGAWTNRTMAQLLTDIQALPLAGGTVTGALNVTGAVGITGTTTVTTGDVVLATLGRSVKIAEGTNAKMGILVLNGTTGVVVNTTAVGASSRIFLTTQLPGGTLGTPVIVSRVAGTSFTARSSVAGDVSSVAWWIVDPA